MEGNFYISDTVIKRDVRSAFGKAVLQCKEESEKYGRCVEAGQVNRTLKKGLCEAERRALRQCVDSHCNEAKAAYWKDKMKV